LVDDAGIYGSIDVVMVSGSCMSPHLFASEGIEETLTYRRKLKRGDIYRQLHWGIVTRMLEFGS
jgi:hypothetical protein